MAIALGVFDNKLIGGPEFVVSAPSVDPLSAGVTSVTPVELDNTALRLLWNFASALILVAIALVAFAWARVIHRIPSVPLFSDGSTGLLSGPMTGALVLVGIGGAVRLLIAGRIGDSAGLKSINFNDDDYSLFIFDIPFLPVFLVASGIGWVWKRGQKLQDDMEHTV